VRSPLSTVRSDIFAGAIARIRAVAESPELLAIQRALPISFAGFFIGLGIFMLGAHGSLQARFRSSFGASFAVMSVVLVVVLAFDLAPRRNVPRALAVIVAAAAFALSLPYRVATSVFDMARIVSSSGLFLALGIALVTVAALAFGRRLFGVVAGYVLAGGSVIGAAGALLALGISLTAALNAVLAPLGDLGDSLTALLVITLVETLLWLVGIHGPALLAAIVLPVYMHLQTQNTDAIARGTTLPHIVTVSTFLYVFPGGAGATLPLVVLLLRSKVKRVRNIAFATILPSIASVNEPLMFGLPIVLNPTLGVPFVVAPLVLAIVSWEAMNLHLVALPAYYIPYTVPPPLNVYWATNGDWRSIVLVVVNLVLALAIYAPFVAAYERQQLARSAATDAA
jgi:cellobiose-specific phosphotransferase system component IIC